VQVDVGVSAPDSSRHHGLVRRARPAVVVSDGAVSGRVDRGELFVSVCGLACDVGLWWLAADRPRYVSGGTVGAIWLTISSTPKRL
jgi:hypothetical protein